MVGLGAFTMPLAAITTAWHLAIALQSGGDQVMEGAPSLSLTSWMPLSEGLISRDHKEKSQILTTTGRYKTAGTRHIWM